MDVVELIQDKEELLNLLQQTRRINNRQILQKSIDELTKKVNEVKPVENNTNTKCSINQTPVHQITEYSWSQSNDIVSVTITIPEVATLAKELIDVSFTEESCNLMVNHVNGKRYCFKITKLLSKIDVEQSKHRVKNDRLTLSMKKKNNGDWECLKFADKVAKKETPKFDKDNTGSPEESLMGMMKNLYETGDDEMKKVIAKAFTEARQKQNDV